MAFATSFESLVDVLAERFPAKSTLLAREHRRVDHGLLSVGLKLHCFGDGARFAPLIEALGGTGRCSGATSTSGRKPVFVWYCRRREAQP